MHERNIAKACRLKKSDCVMVVDSDYCDRRGDGIESLQLYTYQFLQKRKTTRFSYNIDLLQKWAFTRFGERSFAEELVHNGFSLWPSVELFMQGDIGQLGYELSYPGITFYIDVILEIVKDIKPRMIVIENRKDDLNKIIIKICSKEHIKVRCLGISGENKRVTDVISNNPFLLRNYIKSRIKARKAIGRAFCRKMPRKDIIIITNDRLSHKENRNDYYWGPIIKELERRKADFKVIEYDRIESWKSLALIKDRYITNHYDAQFIGTYYSPIVEKDTDNIVNFFKYKFRELDQRDDFRNSFEYKDVNFYDIIRKRLAKIFKVYSYYMADVYAVTREIIREERPRMVLIDHEKNFYGRGLLTEANRVNNVSEVRGDRDQRSEGIRTFAFEGEILYGSNKYLTHIPNKDINDRKSPLWRPVADVKFLWGEYSKEWYAKKNHFPEKSLKVIGAPKYDFLKELGLKDKEDIRRRYNIKKDEKVITVITVEWPKQVEYLTSIARSLSGRQEYKLIIKMHPTDPHANKGMIYGIMKKFGINSSVVQYDNCSKLIFSADLVISCASTVIYECIFLGKETLVYGSEEDSHQAYIKEKAVELCINPDDLIERVKMMLDSLEARKKSQGKKGRDAFIKKYLYSDDGKSSRRAVYEIMKLTKKDDGWSR